MTAKLDEAYALLEATGPEYGPLGLSNHGPMAAEALAAAGREDAILPWVEHYARQLDPRPSAQQPIDPAAWQTALGRVERHADWVVFFEQEMATSSWQAMVRKWAALLAPGLSGGALHGLLRAGHAVRAVQAHDVPVRRRELAQGMAYWAACYTKLPGDPDGSGTANAIDALPAVVLLPQDRRPDPGLITTALAELEGFAPFRDVANAVDVGSRPPQEILSDLTQAFAAAYLGNATPDNLIAVIHMLTGPSVVRLLLPHVDDATARSLVAYAWQAGCALYCAFATTALAPPITAKPPPADDLLDRALRTKDEHAIKLTEACLREESACPHPVFRAAADDVIHRTPMA